MAWINGTNSANTLEGTEVDDRIKGLGGNDRLFGAGGSDQVYGGDGNDKAFGGAGYDVVWGDDGDDQLFGDANDDNLFGGNGDDALLGGDGDDYLDGGAGNDVLDGGLNKDLQSPAWWTDSDMVAFNSATSAVTVNFATGVARDGLGGKDTLIDIEVAFGTRFNDRLIGGNAANDDFEGFRGERGSDFIDGGSGFDMAYFSSFPGDGNGIRVDLAEGFARDAWGAKDTLVSVEGIWATEHDDILKGSAAAETFISGDGLDKIDGRGGVDTVSYFYERTAADRPHGIDANLARGTIFDMKSGWDAVTSVENVIGSRLDDEIRGDANDNLLDGSFGDDLLKGGGGKDKLLGDTGNDDLDGGNGFDKLDGGTGNDTLRGGAGGDTFIFSKNCDEDHIVDFGAGDKIDLSAFGFKDKNDVLEAYVELSPGAAMLDLGGDNYIIFDYVDTSVPILQADDIII